MAAHEKVKLFVDSHLSVIPEIARWLWALQDGRRRTLDDLQHVTPDMLDWRSSDEESSIGTVLYHMAVIEADWLYEEVLVSPFPPAVSALFPYEIRDTQGHLTHVDGLSLDDHLERLASVRQRVLDTYTEMDLADFRRARLLPDYDVTPEWVLHHLIQHEAEHRGQIGTLRDRAERDVVK